MELLIANTYSSIFFRKYLPLFYSKVQIILYFVINQHAIPLAANAASAKYGDMASAIFNAAYHIALLDQSQIFLGANPR